MTYITKDSGAREQMGGSEMVRDIEEGKPRFDLLLPVSLGYEDTMLYRWAMLMTRGAGKYGVRNWEHGEYPEAYGRAKSSAARHMVQWLTDDSPEEDHAAAIFFNVAAAEYYKTRASQEAG